MTSPENTWTLLDWLGQPYFQRALLAAVMTGAACALLGCLMVLRQMALIGDALSHAILPGVVVGFMAAGHSLMAFFLGSVGAGLMAAVLIAWLQNRGGARNDAAIGIVFSSMFALGVIGISALSRKEGVHLDMKDFLFGNVLGIGNEDLWLIGLVLGFDVLCLVWFYPFFFASTFQPDVAKTMGIPTQILHYFTILMLSLTVVASLQSVGVILVFSMLIVPASTALIISHNLKHVLVLAVVMGAGSSVVGLLGSLIWDTAPGPAITLTATTVYLLFLVLHPTKGLWPKRLRQWHRKVRHLGEDLLKAVYRNQDLSALELRNQLHWTAWQWRFARWWCLRQGWLGSAPDATGRFSLHPQGVSKALQLLRAHRLWESYLAEKQGFEPHQLHWLAERDEHILPPKFVEDLDRSLGYPTQDPHGSPIPRPPRAETNPPSTHHP